MKQKQSSFAWVSPLRGPAKHYECRHAARCNSPVIQNSNDLSRLEGQFVVLGSLEVVDGAYLASLWLAGGEQAAGAGVEA